MAILPFTTFYLWGYFTLTVQVCLNSYNCSNSCQRHSDMCSCLEMQWLQVGTTGHLEKGSVHWSGAWSEENSKSTSRKNYQSRSTPTSGPPKVSARTPAHRSYHFRGVKLKSCIKKIHHNLYISKQANVRIKHADTEGASHKKFGTDARVQ